MLAAVAIPLLLLLLAAIAGNMIQHRLVWSAEPLKPKLSKISPLAGFKRLFSKQALVNFVKGLIKLALLGAVMTALLWPQRIGSKRWWRSTPSASWRSRRSLSLEMLGAVVAILALSPPPTTCSSTANGSSARRCRCARSRRSIKQTEGDPMVKAKIRQIRQGRAQKRMMAAVPKASVVITNPTHYAVALKYERGMNAPVCVAKGVDAVALKIREVAGEHGMPIVENPPLARALHATVEIEQEIPAEHYKAVAEVIGYVMRLKRGLGRRN